MKQRKSSVLKGLFCSHLMAMFVTCGFSAYCTVSASEDLFNVMDADSNDSISLQETNNYSNVRLKFSTLDSDNSGDLSRNEFLQYDGNVNFGDIDKDHDSLLSVDETSRLPKLRTRFHQLDTNRDSHLDAEEYSVYQSTALE